MKKLCCIMLFCLILSGCVAKKTHVAGYTFTDDLGRTVTVPSTQRVAALLGSYADIWHLAGGTVCASADDAWDDFNIPMAPDAVNLGNTKNLSLEVLLASKPDFVLASTNTPQHLQWEATLKAAGIAVAYFDVSCFEDYLRVLKVCTDLTGHPERYEQYGLAQRGQIEEIVLRHREDPAQRVLVLRASASSIRAKNSDGTVLGTMLRDFGCVNIADSETSLLENLSIESIVLQNPDKIFFIQTGDDMDAVKGNVAAMFEENPLWYELDAVKNGHVYFMEKPLYNLKPNARWAEAYEKLEGILYEETQR